MGILRQRGAADIPEKSITAGVIGAILFVLSDTILVVNMFNEDLPAARWLIMLPYWAGQCGFFLSAMRRDASPAEAG